MLYVDTYRLFANSHRYGMLAMRDRETWTMLQAWSAVFVIEEEREASVRCPAARRGKQLHKQLVGLEATELPKQMFVAQCLFTALVTDQRQQTSNLLLVALRHIVENEILHYNAALLVLPRRWPWVVCDTCHLLHLRMCHIAQSLYLCLACCVVSG